MLQPASQPGLISYVDRERRSAIFPVVFFYYWQFGSNLRVPNTRYTEKSNDFSGRNITLFYVAKQTFQLLMVPYHLDIFNIKYEFTVFRFI